MRRGCRLQLTHYCLEMNCDLVPRALLLVTRIVLLTLAYLQAACGEGCDHVVPQGSCHLVDRRVEGCELSHFTVVDVDLSCTVKLITSIMQIVPR